MPPRRILSFLGPALALGALACGSVSWSLDLPQAAAFVGRGLSKAYGISLTAGRRTEVSLLPLPRIGFADVTLRANGLADGWADGLADSVAGDPAEGTARCGEGPVLAQGGSLSLQLGLGALLLGRVEVVSLSLDNAHIALPESADDTRWSLPLKRLSQTLAAGGAHPRRIALRHATVSGRDPRDGRPETVRDVEVAALWPLWSDTLALAGSLTWNGAAARFALSDLRPDRLLIGAESPFIASLAWPAGSFAANGTGRLGKDSGEDSGEGLSLTGQASLRTGSLPETLRWIGGDAALSPLIETFSVEGRFAVSGGILNLPAMRVSAGDTVLEGAGSAELNGRRPSIRATLDAHEINLGPVLAGLMRAAGLDDDGEGHGWGRRSLALSPLTGGDLDLRLSGDRARLGPVLLEDLAASVMVRADGIDATLGRASLRGGTLKGRVGLAMPRAAENSAEPAETEMRAQGAFDGLDLGALLVDLGGSGWMLGATRGSVSVEGRGRDADSLVRRLSGRALVAVEGGAITGLDLADVIHRGGAVAPGPLARRNSRTAFERAQASLVFSEGVGEIEDGALSGRTVTAALRGRISLPDKTFLARAALLPRRLVAGETVPLPGATLFEMAGPWDAVTVRPRPHEEAVEPDASESPIRGPAALALPSQVRAYAP